MTFRSSANLRRTNSFFQTGKADCIGLPILRAAQTAAQRTLLGLFQLTCRTGMFFIGTSPVSQSMAIVGNQSYMSYLYTCIALRNTQTHERMHARIALSLSFSYSPTLSEA